MEILTYRCYKENRFIGSKEITLKDAAKLLFRLLYIKFYNLLYFANAKVKIWAITDGEQNYVITIEDDCKQKIY